MQVQKRLLKVIGKRVAARRVATGMTQLDLADKLGVSNAHVS